MKSKAQSTIEYCVLLGVIVAALIGMQVYLKRGLQGKMRGYAGQLSGGVAYSPGATIAYSKITLDTTENTLSYPVNLTDSGGKFFEDQRETKTNSETNISTERSEEVLASTDEPRRW